MRRLEYLITEARNATDNKDTNGVTTAEFVNYFNDAQRYITSIIFKSNPYADLFKSQAVFTAVSTGIYTLPSDCYSSNSISMVEGSFGASNINDGYIRIKPIAESEIAYLFGYVVRNNTIIISGSNDTANIQSIRITYFRQLKTLDIRRGKVSAVSPGISITLPSAPTELYTMDDHCSACDNQGDQVVDDIYFTNTSGTALLTADTAGVTTSHYITAGKNSQNKSELPDVCETYLLDYVKQRIYTRNNYDDAEKQMYFTEQQRQDIISIFSNNKKDDDIVPITDTGFLSF